MQVMRQLANLQHLSVNGRLPPIDGLKNLTYLQFEGGFAEDEDQDLLGTSSRNLQDMQRLQRLQRLNLADCPVVVAGGPWLASLQDLVIDVDVLHMNRAWLQHTRQLKQITLHNSGNLQTTCEVLHAICDNRPPSLRCVMGTNTVLATVLPLAARLRGLRLCFDDIELS